MSWFSGRFTGRFGGRFADNNADNKVCLNFNGRIWVFNYKEEGFRFLSAHGPRQRGQRVPRALPAARCMLQHATQHMILLHFIVPWHARCLPFFFVGVMSCKMSCKCFVWNAQAAVKHEATFHFILGGRGGRVSKHGFTSH